MCNTDMTKLLVNEMFASIAGEGERMGNPNFFLRLSGCNLYCSWRGIMGVSVCDSLYASHPDNLNEIKFKDVDSVYNELEKLFKEYPNIKQLTITGGEPLLQPKGLDELLKRIFDEHDDISISIETNGTISPTVLKHKDYVDLWTVSPKLQSSCCFDDKVPKAVQQYHSQHRINYNALYEFIDWYCLQTFNFKFVIASEDDVEEVRQIVKNLNKEWNRVGYSLNEFIYIMPCGETREKLEEMRKYCVEVCKKEGWNYTDRLQVVIWGDKRGV